MTSSTVGKSVSWCLTNVGSICSSVGSVADPSLSLVQALKLVFILECSVAANCLISYVRVVFGNVLQSNNKLF